MAKCTGTRCPMQYGYKVEECNQTDCPYRTEPITNADRIRAMSDEELADMRVRYNPVTEMYINDTDEAYYDFVSAMEAELEWLQQPAEKKL